MVNRKFLWSRSKKWIGQGDDYTTGCLLDYPSSKIIIN